jgi:hypothetical protein
MTTAQQLSDSFDSMAQTALRVKAERDELLAACKFALDWVDTWLPHLGPAEEKLIEVLQTAIAKTERST